jgi:3-methylfumaryl-CoA hydratase
MRKWSTYLYKKVRKKPDLTLDIMPSSILLFRYSALTFNSHKIHYDHEYATKIENHPGKIDNNNIQK